MIHILSLYSLSLRGAPTPLFRLFLAEAEEISSKWRVTNPRWALNVDCESRNLLQMASLVCGLEDAINLSLTAYVKVGMALIYWILHAFPPYGHLKAFSMCCSVLSTSYNRIQLRTSSMHCTCHPSWLWPLLADCRIQKCTLFIVNSSIWSVSYFCGSPVASVI